MTMMILAYKLNNIGMHFTAVLQCRAWSESTFLGLEKWLSAFQRSNSY